ncbi:hypothetical protein P3339_16160 [Microbulbifer sp. MLAF003]|uniref:hypothetical protein n=1 Tax=unclassified Microbulbifer TaxID=2619833 RepID=UPI0024AC88E4|nr:hypothetical protein [Microbulbifer sp. MLAF003]WHI49976.1 hypothetical protein P3339_16160 [Microbulbifer sp. MLAF003]
MKDFGKVLFLIIFFVPLLGRAEWTPYSKISYMKVHDAGVEIRLQNFTNTSSEINCKSDVDFHLTVEDTKLFDTKLSFLLSAYVAKETVSFSYYECNNTGSKILLSSVMFPE